MFKRYAITIVLTLFLAMPSTAGDTPDFDATKKLAEQGNANAQSNLGVMYAKGQGVPQNDKEAVKWFTKSAEQGISTAQYNLGLIYLKGQGVPQDYKEAVKWYVKSAEQGYAMAQHTLGVMYATGRGVPQNYEQAYIWLSLAAAQSDGPKDAQTARDAVVTLLTPERLNVAQQSAAEVQKGITEITAQQSAAEVQRIVKKLSQP